MTVAALVEPGIAMEIRPGLHRTGTLDVEAARRMAEEAGYACFVLPRGTRGRPDFFDAVRATFPLDPPLLGYRSWDALSDSLWEGLHTHGARRIAIFWPGTREMATLAPADFEIALGVLSDVATTLGDPRLTLDNPKEVAVLVE